MWSTSLAMVREARALSEVMWSYPLGLGGGAAAPQRRTSWRTAAQCEPVVLVHGYAANSGCWRPVRSALHHNGFAAVRARTTLPVGTCVATLAAQLADDCADVLAETGAERVHLVGHSLGGIVVRYAVLRLGLAPSVRSAVTIAAPHRGTPLAFWGSGLLAAELCPGSPLLRALDEPAGEPDGGVEWTSYYSDCDLVVPADSARLGPGGADVAVPGQGHLSILRSAQLLQDLPQRLRGAEDRAAWAEAVRRRGTEASRRAGGAGSVDRGRSAA